MSYEYVPTALGAKNKDFFTSYGVVWNSDAKSMSEAAWRQGTAMKSQSLEDDSCYCSEEKGDNISEYPGREKESSPGYQDRQSSLLESLACHDDAGLLYFNTCGSSIASSMSPISQLSSSPQPANDVHGTAWTVGAAHPNQMSSGVIKTTSTVHHFEDKRPTEENCGLGRIRKHWRRKRVIPRLSRIARSALELVYNETPRPSGNMKKKLEEHCNIDIQTIQIWFSHRRAKSLKERKRKCIEQSKKIPQAVGLEPLSDSDISIILD